MFWLLLSRDLFFQRIITGRCLLPALCNQKLLVISTEGLESFGEMDAFSDLFTVLTHRRVSQDL